MLAFSNDYYGMIFRATQSVELFCAYDEFVYNIRLPFRKKGSFFFWKSSSFKNPDIKYEKKEGDKDERKCSNSNFTGGKKR